MDTYFIHTWFLYSGAMGQDFSSFSNTTEAEIGLQKVSYKMLEYGVTSYCPTLVTSPPDYYKMVSTYTCTCTLYLVKQVLPVMKRKKGGEHGATMLGTMKKG